MSFALAFSENRRKRSSEMGEACRLYPEGWSLARGTGSLFGGLVASLATFALALAAMMKHELWAQGTQTASALLQVSRLLQLVERGGSARLQAVPNPA
jgi:hypothetical protein